MVLRFTVQLRDLEAFLRYVTIVAFSFYLLLTYLLEAMLIAFLTIEIDLLEDIFDATL